MKPSHDSRSYHYGNRQFESEQALLVFFLDQYRCIEDFAARYLGAWRSVCTDARIRGGLSTICGRERAHATALEARLRELGGSPQAQMPANRLPDLEFYGATENSDAAKLEKTARQLSPPQDPIGSIMDVIALIQDDAETRELLLTIVDDEKASIRWIVTAAGIESDAD